MCKTVPFCTFFVQMTVMKHFFLLLMTVILVSACGSSRRVSTDMAGRPTWVGSEALDIIKAMGNPDRIDENGRGGSILRYDSTPDYSDPKYDILDPEAAKHAREYAYFYRDEEGVCYSVDTNHSLPAPPSRYSVGERTSVWLDLLIWIPIMAVTLIIP